MGKVSWEFILGYLGKDLESATITWRGESEQVKRIGSSEP